MLKRYLVFAYEQYYPGGGWNDFIGSYDTLDEALQQSISQVVDSHTGLVVAGDVPLREMGE